MSRNILSILLGGAALVALNQAALAHEEDEVAPQQIYQAVDARYSDPRYSDPRYSDPRYSDPRYNDPRYNDPRADYRSYDRGGGGRLSYEVDHLNRMLTHVDRSMRRYGATRQMWREYAHLRAEADQLNRQFRRGEQYYNRRRLRAEIEHMHSELHQLEEQLRVPSSGWYRWR